MKNDPLIDFINEKIKSVQALSAHIQNRLLPGLEKAVFEGNCDDIFVNAISIDFIIPVALSGCAAFYINDHGEERPINIIMNVIPSNGQSLIISCGDVLNKDLIEYYIASWCTNVFKLLSMVEAWMVNGTDQWYIKPSAWEAISDTRKKAILNDLYECKQNIGQEYAFSIFDEIRKEMLTTLKKKEKPTEDGKYWQLVKEQRAKMT
jgi:hypothetical protein